MSRKTPTDPPSDARKFSATLGELLAARGLAPATPPAAVPASAPATAPPPAPNPTPPADRTASGLLPSDVLRRAGKLVVRREKAGRGGKTVTIVSGLDDVPEDTRLELLRALKSALGCGATLEGADLVFQGDQTARVAPLLTAAGARQVVRGN